MERRSGVRRIIKDLFRRPVGEKPEISTCSDPTKTQLADALSFIDNEQAGGINYLMVLEYMKRRRAEEENKTQTK